MEGPNITPFHFTKTSESWDGGITLSINYLLEKLWRFTVMKPNVYRPSRLCARPMMSYIISVKSLAFTLIVNAYIISYHTKVYPIAILSIFLKFHKMHCHKYETWY